MQIPGKIIGVGFQKTGTSSLREALKILGYRVKDTSTRPLFPILQGKFDRVVSMLRNFDAAEDTPWYMIYRELDERIPGSKFILTIRDEESWYRSVARHIGILRSAHHEWIYGRGKGLPMEDKENTILVYRRHNRDVVEYFRDRPDDLLVIDFTSGEGWKELCRFLGREVPDVPFPHYNRWETKKEKQSYYGEQKNLKFIRKSVRQYLKIKYIDLMGLWPSR